MPMMCLLDRGKGNGGGSPLEGGRCCCRGCCAFVELQRRWGWGRNKGKTLLRFPDSRAVLVVLSSET